MFVYLLRLSICLPCTVQVGAWCIGVFVYRCVWQFYCLDGFVRDTGIRDTGIGDTGTGVKRVSHNGRPPGQYRGFACYRPSGIRGPIVQLKLLNIFVITLTTAC